MSYDPHQGAPQKKSGPSILLILAIIGGVMFFGMATLIGGGVYLFSQVKKDSGEFETVHSEDGLCSLEIPTNWPTMSAQHRGAGASMMFGHAFGERYVQIIPDTKEAVDELIELSDSTSQDKLKKFADLMMESMTQTSNIEQLGEKEVTINGLRGIEHKFKAKTDGIDVIFWGTFLEGKKHFFQVQVWTLQSREQENRESLFRVARSFKEK